ncbi:MAG: hypothetical protein JEZ14_03605 [Marinilabiliaceae bacterium]|nr:hypothetical protein [Marinilabiliaceae bacterium]
MELFNIDKTKEYSRHLFSNDKKKHRIIKKVGEAIENRNIELLEVVFDPNCTFYGYGNGLGTKNDFIKFVQKYNGRPQNRCYRFIRSNTNVITCRIEAYFEVSKILGHQSSISWHNTYAFNKEGKINMMIIREYRVSITNTEKEEWSDYICFLETWYPFQNIDVIAYLTSYALDYITRLKNE